MIFDWSRHAAFELIFGTGAAQGGALCEAALLVWWLGLWWLRERQGLFLGSSGGKVDLRLKVLD